MIKKLIVLLFFSLVFLGKSQTLTLINQEKNEVSFRGISIVNENIYWVSGSLGTIGKTVNGGKTFSWFYPKGFNINESKHIHATPY